MAINFRNAKDQIDDDLKYKYDTVPEQDPAVSFLEKLSEFGLNPGRLIPDGQFHRFRDNSKKKNNKDAWYILNFGPVCVGAFGSWSSGISENWCSKNLEEIDHVKAEEYRRQIKLMSDMAKHHLLVKQQQTQKKTKEQFEKASNPDEDHLYLVNKKIKPYGIIKQDGKKLLIPIYNKDRVLWSVQEIHEDGFKHFPKNTQKKGNASYIDGNGNDNIYICEGYSTGCSIHEVTKGTVIVSFDAGNLVPVAKIAKDKYPKSNIIICADNDTTNPKKNPGLEFGKKSAKAINATLTYPIFTKETYSKFKQSERPSDFNDLLNLEGFEVAKKQLFGATEKHDFPPLTMEVSLVKDRVKKAPPPLEFILDYNEQGLIPKGVVGVLTASGGTGKTFFLLSLAYTVASGGNFGPINAPEALNTLVIIGEDDQDELDRRLWNIGKGSFPDKLFAYSVYGEIGPLMRLDGNIPTLDKSYFWLEETIKNHVGLELLIIDPKSRFYGLDENNNDHATQWIQALEKLAKKYQITILFSHHTPKGTDKISQEMSRGASGIVDGCRWQAGLIRMPKETADKYSISNPRSYIIFDAPKNNYAPDTPGYTYYKRDHNGVLEHSEPLSDMFQKIGNVLMKELKLYPDLKYTKNQIAKGGKGNGKEIYDSIVEKLPKMKMKRAEVMEKVINFLIRTEQVEERNYRHGERGPAKLVLFIAKRYKL